MVPIIANEDGSRSTEFVKGRGRQAGLPDIHPPPVPPYLRSPMARGPTAPRATSRAWRAGKAARCSHATAPRRSTSAPARPISASALEIDSKKSVQLTADRESRLRESYDAGLVDESQANAATRATQLRNAGRLLYSTGWARFG